MKKVRLIVPNIILILVVLWPAVGCKVGGNIVKSDFATGPRGDNVEILLKDNRSLRGEFLTLREESIIVLVRQGENRNILEMSQEMQFPVVAGIPFEISRAITLQYKDLMIINRGNLTSKKNLERYRLYSRYPQGINKQLMKELLDAYNQESLFELSLKDASVP